MDMNPEEIVVRYRQAKHKGKQIKILAELNACTVDDILEILTKHGGMERQRISRAIGAARAQDEPAEATEAKPEKKAEKKAFNIVDAALRSVREQFKVINGELVEIDRQRAELDRRKEQIYEQLRKLYEDLID